jgi:hypothetical protein
MSDAFSRLAYVLATAKRAVLPRGVRSATPKAPGLATRTRSRAIAAAIAFVGSQESTELAVVVIWALAALLFSFSQGGLFLPGNEFLPGIAMN